MKKSPTNIVVFTNYIAIWHSFDAHYLKFDNFDIDCIDSDTDTTPPTFLILELLYAANPSEQQNVV